MQRPHAAVHMERIEPWGKERERETRQVRPRRSTDRQNCAHRAESRRRPDTAHVQIYDTARRKTRRQLRVRPPHSGRGEKISWQKIEDKNADAKIKKAALYRTW